MKATLLVLGIFLAAFAVMSGLWSLQFNHLTPVESELYRKIFSVYDHSSAASKDAGAASQAGDLTGLRRFGAIMDNDHYLIKEFEAELQPISAHREAQRNLGRTAAGAAGILAILSLIMAAAWPASSRRPPHLP